ncbi:MAG: hypothetical protein KME58_11575 [Candidatus Thiodiazotropha sp. (ex Lucina pensylvanica)]|nr:hypothetical protein [Candidatus Thiodiazotropha sp. (ex Lucina pensylvanica)]
MRTLKEIGGLLLLAVVIVGIGQFLPGLNVLFDDYLVGFLVAAVAIPVVRMAYKSHMAKIAKLSPEVRDKKKKESQEWWEETSEATYSPSRAHDPRNIYSDD